MPSSHREVENFRDPHDSARKVANTSLSLLTELLQKIAEKFSRSRKGAGKDVNMSLSVFAELLQVY